jgi:hypothetical protein
MIDPWWSCDGEESGVWEGCWVLVGRAEVEGGVVSVSLKQRGAVG